MLNETFSVIFKHRDYSLRILAKFLECPKSGKKIEIVSKCLGVMCFMQRCHFLESRAAGEKHLLDSAFYSPTWIIF